jgi:multiple sugar transport system substrate-binding protein
LEIMHNWNEADPTGIPFRSILAQFEETHADISLKQEVFDVEDVPTKVETAFLANQEPDVIFHNLMSNSLEWNDIGLTVSVADLLAEWELEDQFLQSSLAEYTINEKLVAFPLQGFVWPLWYNTQILDEVGLEVPTTVDQLISAAEKIRAVGYMPWVVGGSDTWAFNAFGLVVTSMLDWEAAEQLFSQGGFRDDPRAVEGIELFVRLRDEGVFADVSPGLDNAGSVQAFANGEAAMAHLGSWSIPEISEELGEAVELAGFPLSPNSPHELPLSFGAFIAKAIWITRNGAQKMDAVRDLVRFIYQPENVAQLVEEAALVPPLKDVPIDEQVLHPVFTKQLALFDTVTITPPIASVVPGSVRPTVLNNVGPLAFVPGTTAEEIMDALQEAYAAAT